jgi:hypothetical protein
MWEIIIALMIMYDMIVEQKHDDSAHDQGCDFQGELVAPNPGLALFHEFLHTHHGIETGQPTTPSINFG